MNSFDKMREEGLLRSLQSAGNRVRELEVERDMLLGKPDAVHLGAQAAVEALRQAQAIIRERDDLRDQLEQATASYRELEPCGHAKNFLIGDEHGHFACTVCQLRRERELSKVLAEALESTMSTLDFAIQKGVLECHGVREGAKAALAQYKEKS